VDKEAAVEGAERKGTGFRGAWRHRQWRLVLSAYAVSATGDWLYDVALITWLLDRTGSPGWVAGAALAKILPAVCVGSLAGVVADRWDRRRLLVRVDVLRALLMVIVAVVIAADGAPALVLLVVVVNALLGTAYRPAIIAVTPQVVDEHSLAAANAIEGVVGQVTWFIGPALGALVLVIGSVEAAFLLDAATFAVSAALLVRLRLPSLSPEGEVRRSFLGQFRDGVASVRDSPDLIAILGQLWLRAGSVRPRRGRSARHGR
jgi:MFS family permease